LRMPAARSFLGAPMRRTFTQHLAFALRLRAQRIMLEHKLVRIDAARRETDVVPGIVRQIDACAGLLPGAALMEVAWMIAELEMTEMLLEVAVLGVKIVVGWPEIQRHMINGREAALIGAPQRIAQ